MTFDNTFKSPGDRSRSPAANANTLGEVPNSSWFQNRHVKQMSAPAAGERSEQDRRSIQGWILDCHRRQTEGVTPVPNPRFTWRYLCRQIRSANESGDGDGCGNHIDGSSSMRWATTFENYPVFRRGCPRGQRGSDQRGGLDPSDVGNLDPSPEPTTSDKRYRAVASKVIEGRPIGPFNYHGTRPDDPNDVIPHEHRRELRGLRVFSAWLNHDDSRAVNTQDSVVAEGGRRYIRHYLIDFGSTLGSGSVVAQKPRAGWNIYGAPPVLRRIVQLECGTVAGFMCIIRSTRLSVVLSPKLSLRNAGDRSIPTPLLIMLFPTTAIGPPKSSWLSPMMTFKPWFEPAA